MPRVATSFGIFLIALGVAGYLLTGRASVTALIPAFFGVGLVAAGLVGRREQLRKHAMHAAAVIALLGVLGAFGRAVPAMLGGSLGTAIVMQLMMGAVLLVFLILCVRSFLDARRSGAV